MVVNKIKAAEIATLKTELREIKKKMSFMPVRLGKGGGGGGRQLIKLTCKTELNADAAYNGKVGAYDFTIVSIDNSGNFIDGESYSYPDAYAREINFSNANLHGPTNNFVYVEQISTLEDGTTIYWFDKGLTDEAYEDRDVFTPAFFYCQDESSSSSS